MADLARLGIIVDATGARREIKLTAEELRNLANTGKLVQTQVAAVPQAITQTSARAGQATLEIGKLRQGMTSLAIAAGALPGPLGRIASTLAPLALGGGVTVGVLAGITAISFAYDKLTESARKSKEELERNLEVLRKLKREQDLGVTGEAGSATNAARARLATITGELAPMNAQITNLRASGEWVVSGQKASRRSELVREASELIRLIAAGEKEITRITGEESAKRQKIIDDEFMRRMQWTGPLAPSPFGPSQPLTGAARARAAEDAFIGPGLARPGAEIPGFDQDIFRQNLFNIRRDLDAMADAARENAARLRESAQQVKAAGIMMAQAGLGAIAANNRGNLGGVLAGTAMGAISGFSGGGGLWGALAGGAIGLVGGILGMNSAAKENREAMRREIALREKLNEQLQTAIRNAPSGFSINRYPQFSPDRREGPITPPGGGGSGPGPLSAVMNITINVDGSQSGKAMVDKFLAEVQKRANATVGNGGTLADALSFMMR